MDEWTDKGTNRKQMDGVELIGPAGRARGSIKQQLMCAFSKKLIKLC